MTRWPSCGWIVLPLLWLLIPATSLGVGKAIGPKRAPPTLIKLVQDLSSENSAKRRYAGRVLHSRAKTARSQAARGPEDDLTRADAMQVLTDFDQLVAPACIRHIALPEVTAACADILRLLETRTALSALKGQLERETRRREKRRLTKAIERIEAVGK